MNFDVFATECCVCGFDNILFLINAKRHLLIAINCLYQSVWIVLNKVLIFQLRIFVLFRPQAPYNKKVLHLNIKEKKKQNYSMAINFNKDCIIK